MADTVLVKNANRMMMVASLLEDGIELSFADGCKGLIPFDDIPEIKERTAVSSLSLPNPYEMVLETVRGERIEIPWDFARHYCDAIVPSDGRGAGDAGKADTWQTHPPAKEVRGDDSTGAGYRSGHRSGNAGADRERRTDAQVQDAERNRASAGKDRRRVANGSRVALLMVACEGSGESSRSA